MNNEMENTTRLNEMLPYSENLVNDLKGLKTYKQRYEVLNALEVRIFHGIAPTFRDNETKAVYEKNIKEIESLKESYRPDF